MIKLQAIQDFTLERFDELKNIQRVGKDIKGKLYENDKFECEEDLARYLLGENPIKKVVVKIIEVEPKKEIAKNEKIKYNNNKKGGKKNGK